MVSDVHGRQSCFGLFVHLRLQIETRGAAYGPVQVSVIKLQPQSLQLTTELPGRITAYLTAEIRPQVNGIIQKRLFQEGAMVHAGQVLYQIDPASYQASWHRAKANLASAEANLPSLQAKADRYRDLERSMPSASRITTTRLPRSSRRRQRWSPTRRL